MIHKEHLLAIGNDRLRRLATYASIAVAVVLIAAKLLAYLFTDSVAMLSSLLDSTIDLLASLVTAYGVASALRPPDREHRFGHGKAEPLAALAQAAFIIGSSVLLIYEAIDRFYKPHELQREAFGYGVMAMAIVLTIGLVEFQHYVIRRTSSLAIGADRLHYLGDLLINIAVGVSFALYQWTGLSIFDPIFAILIAGGLGYSAFHIAGHALTVLMDRELPEKDRARIKAIVTQHAAVIGLHDMRTRTDSDHAFIELHVEMDGAMSLRDAHEVVEDLERIVCNEFPNADVLIHQDPAGIKEIRLDEQIANREAGTPQKG